MEKNSEYKKERDEALMTMDESTIRAMLDKHGIEQPPESRFWATVHQAITGSTGIDRQKRLESVKWLVVRGMKHFLNDMTQHEIYHLADVKMPDVPKGANKLDEDWLIDSLNQLYKSIWSMGSVIENDAQYRVHGCERIVNDIGECNRFLDDAVSSIQTFESRLRGQIFSGKYRPS